MKLLKLILCANIVMFLTTGCNISTESPEELVEKPVVYDSDKLLIEDQIKSVLTNSQSLIYPSNLEDVGKINEVDLDNDGKKEIVAFEKEEHISKEEGKKSFTEVGFMVIEDEGDGRYIVSNNAKSTTKQAGVSIEYANFYDLDNDGNKEIILAIKDGLNTNMHIYSYKDGEVIREYSMYPSWLEYSDDDMDLKLEIADINNDNKLEIIMLHSNVRTKKLYVSVANYNKGLKLIDHTEIEDVNNNNIANMYITVGNVSSETIGDKTIFKEGIILDIPVLTDNAYTTQILYLKDEELKKAFDTENFNGVKKPYYIPVEDFNSDKVIEIPKFGGEFDAYTKRKDATIEWYRWNGKTDNNESNIVFNSRIYYNYEYNFKMALPNSLEKVIVESEKIGNDTLFKFYDYKSPSEGRKNIFTISVVNKNMIDDKKGSIGVNNIVVGENEEYSFILYQNDLEALKDLGLNEDTLKSYFSLIY